VPDGLHAQDHQVQRPDQLDRDEHLRRTLQDGAEADRHAGGHHVVARRMPGRGRESRPPAMRQRPADDEQHAWTGHDDKDK
jgi:hypothetical protein